MARVEKVNMDSMRWHMNQSINNLGTELVNIMDVYVPGYEREKIMSAFNDLAGYVAVLHSMYIPDAKHFNDISKKIDVMDIYKAMNELD